MAHISGIVAAQLKVKAFVHCRRDFNKVSFKGHWNRYRVGPNAWNEATHNMASSSRSATQNMASSSRGLLTLFPDLNESTREITGAVASEPQPSASGFAPLNFPMRSVEQKMTVQTDIEANQYTLKSCVETMTAVTNLSHRLQSRTNEVQQLNAQLALLQRIVLKAENKELKRKATVMFRFGGPPYAAVEEQGGVIVPSGVENTEATLSRAAQDGGKKKRPAE
ncbi:hypothetical protein HYC85_029551 [Camellia sinensis]|uniref:Uncharacterized protein n=1 Tax=Camellia sinensis TaxID=4442 RepID=A0A7J7FY88_CAMSI|nr:hypothetical protein HYC85_029551 [Camellia sinensis]